MRNRARIEVRSIAPDANPYLALYTLLRTGLEGPLGDDDAEARRARTKFLPDNIYDAVRLFKGSKFVADLLGPEIHQRYIDVKLASADRCPKALGSQIKNVRGPVPPRSDQSGPLEPLLTTPPRRIHSGGP